MGLRGTAILGRATAHPDQMRAYVRRSNADAPDLAPLYLELGRQLAVRGDVAFAQAIYATDCFREITAPHNYGGLSNAGCGATFAGPADGVLAHLQRLFAYATASPLPGQMRKLDPGFETVPRGSAAYMADLGHGQAVERTLAEILLEPTAGEPYQITRAYVEGVGSALWGWQGVKGLVIHRLGSPGADAWTTRRYVGDQSVDRAATTHFLVDDEVILHLTPIGLVAHHTQGRNVTHLGIAVCEHNWGTRTWGETYRKLVWLVAYLVRCLQLTISEVTGRFWWEPVRCANDPTHLGWTLDEGRAGGLFDWNQFIADVHSRLAEAYAVAMAAEQAVLEAKTVPEPEPEPQPEPQPVAEQVREPEPVAEVVPESEPPPGPGPAAESAPPPAPEAIPAPAPLLVAAAPPPQPLRGRRPARPARTVCRGRGQRKW